MECDGKKGVDRNHHQTMMHHQKKKKEKKIFRSAVNIHNKGDRRCGGKCLIKYLFNEVMLKYQRILENILEHSCLSHHL